MGIHVIKVAELNEEVVTDQVHKTGDIPHVLPFASQCRCTLTASHPDWFYEQVQPPGFEPTTLLRQGKLSYHSAICYPQVTESNNPYSGNIYMDNMVTGLMISNLKSNLNFEAVYRLPRLPPGIIITCYLASLRSKVYILVPISQTLTAHTYTVRISQPYRRSSIGPLPSCLAAG